MKRLSMILIFLMSTACIGKAIAKQNKNDSDVPYVIRKIKKSTKKRAYVENAWRGDVPCIRVDIRTKEDLGNAKFYVKAYFYDKKKKLVYKYQQPAEVSDDWKNYKSIPDYLKPRKIYDVYFPITDKIKKGKYKWKSVVIVFGGPNQAVADVYKSGNILDYTFPEKNLLKKR